MNGTSLLLSTPTFRDPAGTMQLRSDGAYRHIGSAFAEDLLDLLSTSFYANLVKRDLLVGTEVVSGGSHNEPLILRHPLVSFRSYPWEWPPALWRSAAELTLDVCAELLQDGWILKDATPLNVLFQGMHPIFVDVASIARLDVTRPLWFAYGQFVRTFLLPLIAHAQLGWSLQATMTRRDGYEPQDINSALPWSRKLRRPALTSVAIPMLFAKGGNKLASRLQAQTVSDPEMTRKVIGNTLAKLRHDIQRVAPRTRASQWSDYTESAGHYSDKDHAAKRSFVVEVWKKQHPTRVLDVGCNTGAYSILAADNGAEVVSIDTDVAAVERLCNDAKINSRNILPLCVDLAHPTPAVGWENNETASFPDRCYGYFDTVMMLAVMHHLLLTSQVPMVHIASLCSRMTTRDLIIEWIPQSDPKFVEMLRGREAIYQHLTESSFRDAFAQHFEVVTESTLENGRVLFHMRRR